MSAYQFSQADFHHPGWLFRAEFTLLAPLIGRLYHRPLIQRLQISGHESVLDFGCGGGTSSSLFARLLKGGGKLVCLDISQPLLEIARQKLRKYSNIEFLSGDIRDVSPPPSHFDVISIMNMFHDIPPADRPPIGAALIPLLKPGGRLLIDEPTNPSHGIDPSEIRHIFQGGGLVEKENFSSRKRFSCIYQNPQVNPNENIYFTR